MSAYGSSGYSIHYRIKIIQCLWCWMENAGCKIAGTECKILRVNSLYLCYAKSLFRWKKLNTLAGT
jgi:hypothetical protein